MTVSCTLAVTSLSLHVFVHWSSFVFHLLPRSSREVSIVSASVARSEPQALMTNQSPCADQSFQISPTYVEAVYGAKNRFIIFIFEKQLKKVPQITCILYLCAYFASGY